MRVVEGGDFREFSAYLTKLGLYAGEGELDRLKGSLESGSSNLIVLRENGEIIGHARVAQSYGTCESGLH
jgi:hypothetical protein